MADASRMWIADGHADSLMWNRDLTVESGEGDVDFPRLRQAGVGLQCFTVVTRGWPFVDGFGAFAWAKRWPAEARRGEWARANWQIDRLYEFCARSNGEVQVARSGAELEEIAHRGATAAVLGIEGAHALERRVERVGELYARGARFMSLTHLGNNELGGSSFPFTGNRPLTPLGRAVLDEMAKVRMPVDVAHASRATLEEILAHPTARPFSSHTGIRGESRSWRNLEDRDLRRIADKGGVVGIIFATVYLGGRTFDDVARHVVHAIAVMGEDGVGFGSDFDGMVPKPEGMRDVRDVPGLADALKRRGLAPAQVEKVMGGNFRRFFRQALG